MSFEAFLTPDRLAPRQDRRLTHAMSLALHGLAVAIGVAYSFSHVDELSPPAVAVIFSGGIVAPPPPPPAAVHRTVRKPPRPSSALTQPRDREVVQPPEPSEDDEGSDDDGVPGGQKGGVAGGPGIGEPPPPPASTFLPPRVASGRLAIDPQDPRYQAHLPAALARAGMTLWAMLKVCVRADGQVGEVTVIRSADPILDPVIVAVIKTWRYQPFSVNGRPVPFCTNVRYEISTGR
jgi:protein TonB